MSVYKRKSDGKWVYDFWRKGVRFCKPIENCGSKRAAEVVEREKKAETAQQLAATRESRPGAMTLSVAFDRFWSEVGDHYTGTYRKTVWTSLAWLLEELGSSTMIRNVGPSKISDAIARRRGQDVKPATVNRTVTEILRRIFIRAKKRWQQDVQDIDWADMMLDEPKERVRELRDHEEAAVFKNMRKDYLPIFAFYLAYGVRLSEAVGLRWRDIDWTAKTISILGKGDKVRVIPLTSEGIAILAPLQGHHAEFVFTYVGDRTRKNPRSGKTIAKGQRYPMTVSGVKSTWRRYGGSEAGLVDFRLHDIRHTTATRLLRETGNLRLVQKLLGHEEISTTTKYAHASDEDLRAGLESVKKSRSNSQKRKFKVAK
ncbi:tyrosine-type recombinase/integrase [Pseudorhodoplanes sinuspersici]|uniref:Uncharacterized protein n=1 Tax=Pseudorhodoplanes sinuspersici TaxID=1235591 RepID=A0A1W6ZX11_9HYPH|nr:tyrosine-type recombinase/integrase [Pseudorhodoplanes sinuspersici]ARQ01922.1 hypothetical protein CAK95_24590 [Pseudorhodoplanes sinuspersici]RKE73693.1 site-specific recombinase XerD [Pseudorhodoplanes sinuspersici]